MHILVRGSVDYEVLGSRVNLEPSIRVFTWSVTWSAASAFAPAAGYLERRQLLPLRLLYTKYNCISGRVITYFALPTLNTSVKSFEMTQIGSTGIHSAAMRVFCHDYDPS